MADPVCGHEFDGARCRKRGEHVCAPRVARCAGFFAELLVHTKGDWARRPFVLAEWELAEVVRPLIGTVEWSEFGGGKYVRRYRELYLSLGKKNGKGELAAGLILYLLCADGEESAEIYGLALDKDQASLIYGVASRMVELSPALGKHLRVVKGSKRIVHDASNSFYAVAAGDALGSLGPSPSCAVIDELLAQPSRDLYDAIHGGFGTRAQPLLILLTTADSDPDGFAASEREWSERVLADPSLDRERLVVLKAVPEDADWADERNWPLANPGLEAGYLDWRVLRGERDKALRNPAAERAFRQFRCNQQQQRTGAAISAEAWDASAGPVSFTGLAERLAGRECWGGLDLASTSDLASYALHFPEGEAASVLWRIFAPEAALPLLDRRTGGKASVWAREGWLTVTEGDVIDYGAIKAALREDAEVFDIRDVAYDRWGATQLSSELLDEGVPLVQVGQGFATLSGPTKEVLRMIAAGQYHHGGNPVVGWQASNVILRTDPAGNLKPDKSRSKDKVDSIVAAVMAAGRAMLRPAPRQEYEAAGF